MTDLHALMGAVCFESGFVIENQLALRYLSESVRTFNTMVAPALTLSAGPAGDPNREFVVDRVLTAAEERALILLAILMWLDGMARKYSFQAIKHSNAAGSTSMDGIEFALSKRAKEIRDKVTGELAGLMDGLNSELNSAAILAGAGHSELGESLPGTWSYYYGPTPPPGPYWGQTGGWP